MRVRAGDRRSRLEVTARRLHPEGVGRRRAQPRQRRGRALRSLHHQVDARREQPRLDAQALVFGVGRDRLGQPLRFGRVAEQQLRRRPRERVGWRAIGGRADRGEHGRVAELGRATKLPEPEPRVGELGDHRPDARRLPGREQLVPVLVQEIDQLGRGAVAPVEPRRLEHRVRVPEGAERARQPFPQRSLLGPRGGREEQLGDLVVHLVARAAGEEQPAAHEGLELGRRRQRDERGEGLRRGRRAEDHQGAQQLARRVREALEDARAGERQPRGAGGEVLFEQPGRAGAGAHRRVRIGVLRREGAGELCERGGRHPVEVQHPPLERVVVPERARRDDPARLVRVRRELPRELPHLVEIAVLEIVDHHPEGTLLRQVEGERDQLLRIASEAGDLRGVTRAARRGQEVRQIDADLIGGLVRRDRQVQRAPTHALEAGRDRMKHERGLADASRPSHHDQRGPLERVRQPGPLGLAPDVRRGRVGQAVLKRDRAASRSHRAAHYIAGLTLPSPSHQKIGNASSRLAELEVSACGGDAVRALRRAPRRTRLRVSTRRIR